MDGKVVVVCAVYGECSRFPVTIARDATVYALQKAVAAVVSSGKQHAVQPRFVTLYLARAKQQDKKEGDGDWLEDDNGLEDLLARAIDPAYEKMDPLKKLNDPSLLGKTFQPRNEHVHVLVELPTIAAIAMAQVKKWPAIDSDVLSRVWSSVVRVSSANVCAGTALVVGRTATHVYLMTNLHLWTDAVFAAHLSREFKKELKRYARMCARATASGKRTADAASVGDQPPRKSAQFSQARDHVHTASVEVVVEQFRGNTMEKVFSFNLGKEMCWSSLGDFDYAIFAIPVKPSIKLVACLQALDMRPTMDVSVVGFPGMIQEDVCGPPGAIIPARVTGYRDQQMVLSCFQPGRKLPRSGILCSNRGVAIGYLGGEVGSMNNEHFGFSLVVTPRRFPSSVSSDAEKETNLELSEAICAV